MNRIQLLRLVRGWLHRHKKNSSLKAAQDIIQMLEETGLIFFYNGYLRPTDMLCDGGVPNDLDDASKGWNPNP